MTQNSTGYPLTLRVFVSASLAIIALFGWSGWLIYKLLPNWQDRGSFGDMFGATGTLFSGLALAAVIYTILHQRQEFSLQQTEQKKAIEALTQQISIQQTTAKLAALPMIITQVEKNATTLGCHLYQTPGWIPQDSQEGEVKDLHDAMSLLGKELTPERKELVGRFVHTLRDLSKYRKELERLYNSV